jgi:hypothetical protein
MEESRGIDRVPAFLRTPSCLASLFCGYLLDRAGKRVSSKGGEVRCHRDFESERVPDGSPGPFLLLIVRRADILRRRFGPYSFLALP